MVVEVFRIVRHLCSFLEKVGGKFELSMILGWVAKLSARQAAPVATCLFFISDSITNLLKGNKWKGVPKTKSFVCLS
jgi:hypothetical protein